MRVSLSLHNYNRMLKTLQLIDTSIRQKFIDELYSNGKEISSRAKEILAEESQRRTSQKYWTGNLQSAIEVNPVIREGNVAGVTVGVDMRKAPYAEWVEIGHYNVAGSFGSQRGSWWEGYHFLERAFAELGPEIPQHIANTLKVTLRTFSVRSTGFAHKGTGRFVKGSAGFNIVS